MIRPGVEITNRVALTSIVVCACLFFTCNSYTPVQTSAYRFLYDYESSALHPDYLLYHHSDDSSLLYFKVNSSELLYTRRTPGSQFGSQIRISWTLHEGSENRLSIIDSSSFEISDYSNAPSEMWLAGSKSIHVPAGKEMLLEITMVDINKQVQAIAHMKVDKRDKISPQNYLLVNTSDNAPLFNRVVGPGSYVNIYSARNDMNAIRIFHFTDEIRLPPPPFSTNQPEIPSMEESSAIAPEKKTDSVITFSAGSGWYYITTDQARSNGVPVMVAGEWYPDIKEVDQLTMPLRYISSKTEFEEIQKHNYPKQLVDRFWLDCAGSKERARDLIRIYYNRVREANYYFTTYTEGWRTDRGMIHVVFGNPSKIIRYDDSETWVYGEEGNVASLQFIFRKIDSPITNNLYVLNRDPLFKSYWERAVTAWRNGKVYNE